MRAKILDPLGMEGENIHGEVAAKHKLCQGSDYLILDLAASARCGTKMLQRFNV